MATKKTAKQTRRPRLSRPSSEGLKRIGVSRAFKCAEVMAQPLRMEFASVVYHLTYVGMSGRRFSRVAQ